MFDDFQPELLYAEFRDYSSPQRRDELSRQCRAKVVEWRWGSCDMAYAFRRPFVKEYCRDDPIGAGWPPGLVLKTEAERQRIIERGDEVTYYLWAPDESEETNMRVGLNEKTLLRHCDLHNQLMDVDGDYSSAKKALRSVAKALNETDWSNIIDVTHDFVVAAVDNTGEVDFATDIKASIPAPKFRALKKNGLI